MHLPLLCEKGDSLVMLLSAPKSRSNNQVQAPGKVTLLCYIEQNSLINLKVPLIGFRIGFGKFTGGVTR